MQEYSREKEKLYVAFHCVICVIIVTSRCYSDAEDSQISVASCVIYNACVQVQSHILLLLGCVECLLLTVCGICLSVVA